MSYSPSDLLDRHLDASVRLHASHVESTGAAQSKHGGTATQPTMLSTSVDALRHELSLLHVELMFERQRREVHTRRGRRLLAHVTHLNSIADQNEAMVSDGFIVQLPSCCVARWRNG